MAASIRAEHAARCVLRSLALAIRATSEDEAQRYTEAAIRFLHVALKEATQ